MVLGYFIVHKEGDVKKQANKSCFRLSLITVYRGGKYHHIALELCLQLLSPVPHPVILSTEKASGDSVLRTSFRHFPSMTLLSCQFPHFANPVAFRVSTAELRYRATWNTRTFEQLQAKLMLFLTGKYCKKESGREGVHGGIEREGKMKREIWKNPTDSQISLHSLWCGRILHVIILLKLDRFLQLQKVL